MTSRSNLAIRAAVDKFGVWRSRRREQRELAGLGDAEFSTVARDLRLSLADLEMLARKRRGRTANLGRLLDSLGIGPAILRAEPAVVRDMERVCALCPASAKCDGDVRAGTLGRTYRAYCPNSDTIEALAAHPIALHESVS